MRSAFRNDNDEMEYSYSQIIEYWHEYLLFIAFYIECQQTILQSNIVHLLGKGISQRYLVVLID